MEFMFKISFCCLFHIKPMPCKPYVPDMDFCTGCLVIMLLFFMMIHKVVIVIVLIISLYIIRVLMFKYTKLAMICCNFGLLSGFQTSGCLV